MALTSTLYGIVFNQFLCAPLAEAVRGRTNTELLNASIIVQGILAIKKEQHPHKLEKRLASLLAPAQRSVTSRDFQAIRQKYIRMVRTHTKDDSEVASGASTVPSWHTLVTRT
jgi:chemotaxis protein MotA